MIKITLKDESIIEVQEGTTILDVAKQIMEHAESLNVNLVLPVDVSAGKIPRSFPSAFW